jgi:lipopolysaccharide biosynthesis regulator YciM
MAPDLLWALLALPLAFALGWVGSRLDLRQQQREPRSGARAYFKGLNLLLNEQHDKAIDAFIEAVQQEPDTSDLHFALGNLFRRRGEYERAVRVHEHLLARSDLPRSERDRAQHALAQDFMTAGLFDRAEQAYRALDGTAFATDAQIALLTLHERSRQWRQAIDAARRLESLGLGSFATRIAHHACELATEADARGDAEAAVAAIAEARRAAPQAPRPLVLQGERAAARGDAAGALAAWGELLAVAPATFPLVAPRYAQQALAAGWREEALARVSDAYRREPGLDLLAALDILDDDPAQRRERTARHASEHPTLGAALFLVRGAGSDPALSATEAATLGSVLARAVRPTQRYRCAACGFETQQHFWQCPGCLGWDTLPPRRLEEQ